MVEDLWGTGTVKERKRDIVSTEYGLLHVKELARGNSVIRYISWSRPKLPGVLAYTISESE